jgi:hypothetical protein
MSSTAQKDKNPEQHLTHLVTTPYGVQERRAVFDEFCKTIAAEQVGRKARVLMLVQPGPQQVSFMCWQPHT